MLKRKTTQVTERELKNVIKRIIKEESGNFTYYSNEKEDGDALEKYAQHIYKIAESLDDTDISYIADELNSIADNLRTYSDILYYGE